jgi:hypothetical protein
VALQEIDEQWGLYDGYSPNLARVLRFRRAHGRHMPLMKVSPPGLDFSNLKASHWHSWTLCSMRPVPLGVLAEGSLQ